MIAQGEQREFLRGGKLRLILKICIIGIRFHIFVSVAETGTVLTFRFFMNMRGYNLLQFQKV